MITQYFHGNIDSATHGIRAWALIQNFAPSNLKAPRIETASLSTKNRKLIRTDQIQRRIAAAAKSRAPHHAS